MKHLFPFFFPDDGIDIADKPITGLKPEKADDDTAFLDGLLADKDKDLLDEDKADKEEKDEIVDEENPDELLEDTEEETEDELIADTNARGIEFGKIKEKYPDFAKTNDFKELRNAYHREGKYTELFPTIEDAQEAAENNETFTRLNDDIINKGDITSLLNGVKEASPESFKKIATSFLDTVAKVDTELYTKVITPVVRNLAKQIYATGQKAAKRDPESDYAKALIATARNIMQYAFDDADEIDKDEPRVDNSLSEEKKEIEREKASIRQEKYTSAVNLCIASAERNLDKAIMQGLDPDGKFNEFTRDALAEKIKNEVKKQIDTDQIHLRKMGSLWKRAEAEGYSRDSLSRIVSAYLERARPIIPNVRNKFRSIAIKGRETNDSKNTDRGIKMVNRGRSGRAPERDGRVNLKAADPKKIDYRKTSDEDIFEGRIKAKG